MYAIMAISTIAYVGIKIKLFFKNNVPIILAVISNNNATIK